MYNTTNNMPFASNSFPQFPHFPFMTSGFPTTAPVTMDRMYMAGPSTSAMNGQQTSAAPMPNQPATSQNTDFAQLQMSFMMLQYIFIISYYVLLLNTVIGCNCKQWLHNWHSETISMPHIVGVCIVTYHPI